MVRLFKGAAHRLPDDDGVFDVLIVGAGPAGSTTAYYLAQYSQNIFAGTPLRIAILEKSAIKGKDKYCGDAWCAPALDILEDMGVAQELVAEGLVNDTLCGGFVSPAGHSYLANDKGTPAAEKNMATRCYAIKRQICDERITMRAAAQPGVSVVEHARVQKTVLDEKTGIWTVECSDGRVFNSRVLVAADGASSNVGRSLGIIKDAPQAVAARRYVKAGTHNFKADGVLLYPDYTLPGYVALFRHYDDTIDLGLYLLPGGAAKDSDLAEIYETKLLKDPFVARALGPRAEFAERLKVASLRLGGVDRSYDDHVLLVGDAAGQVDPLTGEGIHTGMIGGKIAAECIAEMFRTGDFSAAAGAKYHKKWQASFGSDFPISALAGKIVYRLPFLMDAVPVACQGKSAKAGASFFADFGAVMTGVKPKSLFLHPSVAVPLAISTVSQFVKQYIFGTERTYYADPQIYIDKELKRLTSWDAQCLIDPSVQASDLRINVSDPKMDVFAWANSTKHRVLILYGTEYGFSKDLAELLCERLSPIVSPRCISMSQYEVIDWSQESTVLAICSTAGDGDPPSTAKAFFEALQSDPTLCTGLGHIHFSILAPGDSAYPQFASAGKELEQLFTKAGAKVMVDLTTLDSDDASDADVWMRAVEEAVPRFAVATENKQLDYLRSAVQEHADLFVLQTGASRKKPFKAVLSRRKILTALEDSKDPKETWHLELDISHGNGVEELAFEPGDALGVQPENDPKEVEAILALLQFSGESEKKYAQSQLITADLRLSLIDLKESEEEHVIDVVQRVRQSIPAMDIVSKLRPLQPRFYSIASSPEYDKGTIHLCIAAVRYELMGRKRQGVASTYLIDRVPLGGIVRVWVQHNPAFRPAATALMIGPGTGLAPFRSFLRSVKPKFKNAQLYFGCRSKNIDFLYGDELQDWANQEPESHQLFTAFSRDQAEKVYVQDRLRENAESVASFLTNHKDAAVYICGEGLNMASDVKDALYAIVQEHVPGMSSRQDAEAFLKPRLHLDVWI